MSVIVCFAGRKNMYRWKQQRYPERKQPEKTDYSELYQAVSELKDELKLPVILYYAEDFSIREIAEILEITEGAVQKRLARARGKLKKAFEHKEVFV